MSAIPLPDDESVKGLATDQASPVQNLLADAQERRAKREVHLFLDVPTWDGDLVAEYKVFDPDEIQRLAQKLAAASRNGAQPGDNDIAVIIAAHVGLHILDPATGKRVAIEDEFGHVGYDRIAKFLGKEDILKSQSDTIKYLTGERDKDDPNVWKTNLVAITMHANAINRWMRDPSKRTVSLEDLLGEL